MPGTIDGYSSSIVYKLKSLRYIFLYQVWLFMRPNFSRTFIQRADVLHKVCFPACLHEICAKRVEGQCRNCFPGPRCMHEFLIIFLCIMFFLYFPPPHNFSYRPSLNLYIRARENDHSLLIRGKDGKRPCSNCSVRSFFSFGNLYEKKKKTYQLRQSSNIFFCIVIHLSYFSKSNENILCILKIVSFD